MVLLIDNYDSFSYNLYQYIGEITPNIIVKKNDEINIDDIYKLNPTHIILSPGPGYPKDAGICEEIIQTIKNIPILGVCLGHQAICEVFGYEITNAKKLYHGTKDVIKINNSSLIFKGLNEKEAVGRYHSLIAKGRSKALRAIATNSDGEIMAVEHKKFSIFGVQFHPESIMTECGKKILKNFLKETI
ncbi:MAG: aminodeoxychorismate/anthranilate synthase component II [Anaeroplasma sp.]|nr:aminodeoxychorismate/anthranilate synthase component II [Anaeroplasma sp.]